MKKIISLIITAALLFTSVSISFACDDSEKYNGQQKQVSESNKSHAIKLDLNKIPFTQIIVDMGATVTFDKATSVLTVVKGANTIVIDFKSQTVTVNGAAVTNSGIFTAKNNEKQITALLKYLSSVLGTDKDKGTVTGLNAPTNVTVTPVGTTVIANTLSCSTLYMTVVANITAGQATGGRAELYVGSKLIATDSTIAATDTSVTFTTSDGTPTNAELQAIVPTGGVVTVKLYNANNKYVTSAVSNPTLVVDYSGPTITGITSAVYNPATNQLFINVTGAGAIGDKVNVTKISLIDSSLNKTYQLTNTAGTGSTGVVSSANSLVITIGSADKLGLAGFGTGTVTLTVSAGSLLIDAAGNASMSLTAIQDIPVTVINP